MAFIYIITNTINGKSYIGKTENTVDKRFKEHCSEYIKDRCKDRPLYRAMNKYGLESFTVETIEETDQSSEREIYWIEFYGTYSNGYNATKGGDGKSYIDEDFILSQLIENDSNCTKVASIVKHDRATVVKVAKKHGIYKTHVAKGKDHIRTKTSEKDVLEILRLYVPKTFGKRKIAKLLNIDVHIVDDIVRKRAWKHMGCAAEAANEL
jgi:group I intron endonuclease